MIKVNYHKEDLEEIANKLTRMSKHRAQVPVFNVVKRTLNNMSKQSLENVRKKLLELEKEKNPQKQRQSTIDYIRDITSTKSKD